jgi:hypothetical protein
MADNHPMGVHHPSLDTDPEQIAKDVAAAAGAPAMRVVVAPPHRTAEPGHRETAIALKRNPVVQSDTLFWLLVAAIVAGALLLAAGVF